MDLIPASLRYSATKSQNRVNRVRVQPQGSASGQASSNFRFRFPDKSLVALNTVSVVFDLKISNLSNTLNARMPASHKVWRSAQWYVGGVPTANYMSQHMDLVYHSLLKASVDNNYCAAKMLSNNQELIGAYEETEDADFTTALGNTVTSKTQTLIYDSILGLGRSACSTIDESLFGTVELLLTLNDESCLHFHGSGANNASNVKMTVENVYLEVDVVESVSPLYISLLSEKLSSKTNIVLPFQNIISTVSRNTGSNRISVNSACVDGVMVTALSEKYAEVPSASLENGQSTATRYIFNSSKATETAGKTAKISLSVGQSSYPKQPYDNILSCADATCNAIYGDSVHTRNLLFHKLKVTATTAGGSYKRVNYLTDNFIFLTKFCLDQEGWSSRILSGIDCQGQQQDIILNTSNFDSTVNWLITALCTSQLVYNGESASVSVVI